MNRIGKGKARNINIKGMKLFKHQKDVADELREAKGTGKIVLVKSSRQKGKSVLISQVLLFYALRFPKTVSYYIAPTLKQTRPLYKLIVNGLASSGIIKAQNATDLTIEFINGSIIYCKSAEQRSALRGGSCSGLMCVDEAAFIDSETWGIIRPFCDFHKAPILITSTPWIRQGFFWDIYNQGLQKRFNTITIDWSDPKYKESIEQILPPEKLEEYRQALPNKLFKTEYLGEFCDDDALVFPNLRNCLKQAEIGPNDKLYLGIDWSNQADGDYTVLSAFNQDGTQVLLRAWNDLSPLSQIDVLAGQIELLGKKVMAIQVETNSIGTPYMDLLKNKLSPFLAQKVIGFNTSNSSKNALVVNFQTALEGNKVTLLPDKDQINQFSMYSAEYSPKSRQISYSGPRGTHDDKVLATLFAYDALRLGANTGNYHLVMRSRKYGGT